MPDVVAAHGEITVDKASLDGLNFFAMQVNFDNDTWAHGGVQLLDGKREAINWGGLTNLGGGSGDYAKRNEAERAADLDRIQNPGGGKQLVDQKWDIGTAYSYDIQRGDRVIVPAGDYVRSGGEDPTTVDHDRTMYEWIFTVTPADGGEPIYQGTLLNSSDSIASAAVWNESGYGSTDDQLQAEWNDVTFTTDDGVEHDAGLVTPQ